MRNPALIKTDLTGKLGVRPEAPVHNRSCLNEAAISQVRRHSHNTHLVPALLTLIGKTVMLAPVGKKLLRATIKIGFLAVAMPRMSVPFRFRFVRIPGGVIMDVPLGDVPIFSGLIMGIPLGGALIFGVLFMDITLGDVIVSIGGFVLCHLGKFTVFLMRRCSAPGDENHRKQNA
jgi:hypothetical protein